jgi:hypothetical protein
MLILEHKYLLAGIMGLLPLCVAIALAHRLRRSILVSGVVLGLFSPLSYLSEHVYWTPERLSDGGLGIEDVLFCFHVGAMIWVCAAWPWEAKIQFGAVAAVALRRLITVSAVAIVALGLLLSLGVTIMLAFTSVQAIAAVALVRLRPAYIRLVATGAPIFTVYYFLLLGLWTLLMPDFMGMWNGTELVGRALWGVPIEEHLWVITLTAGYSTTMAYALDVQMDL